MKPEKAIEIIKELAHPNIAIDSPDGVDALKLGIEALKLVIYTRSIGQHVDPVLLPGETPADDSP